MISTFAGCAIVFLSIIAYGALIAATIWSVISLIEDITKC